MVRLINSQHRENKFICDNCDDFRAGKNTLIHCFKDYPETYNQFLVLFTRLINIDTLLCTSGVKNPEQRETTAKALEEFGRYFPVNFTNQGR